MPQTLSVIKAAVGGFVGQSAVHPDLLTVASEAVERSVQAGLLIDGHVTHCGEDLVLIVSHEHGEDAEAVHRFAWDAFVEGSAVARQLKLYGAGQDLLVDTFPGSVIGAGPVSAELQFEERTSEPVIVFLASGTSTGAFNIPLYKTFADPFNTPGLVMAESMHAGFAFEVHDVKDQRKIMLGAPEELYDLLVFIGASSRYAVKRVVSRGGDVVAVASTDKLAATAGRYVGSDDPALIVRCQGDFPAVGEALEPFTTPWAVEGFMRGSHIGPLMPVATANAQAGRFDGPSRVVALGFQLAEGQLVGPRDLFDDPSFDNARAEANTVTDYLRKHGPFEPHRLPLDEIEFMTMPSVTEKLGPRWMEIR
jgi:fructose 1,6-bisphosphate aldolase/phosphatase